MSGSTRSSRGNYTSATAGGGLFVDDGSAVTLVDSAFVGNSSALGGGLFIDTSGLSATNCDFVGINVDDNYHANAVTSCTWGTGAAFACDINI